MVKYFVPFSFLFLSLQIFAQQTDVVDFLNISGVITPDFAERKIEGSLMIDFEILKNTDSLFLDAVNFQIFTEEENGIKISSSDDKIWLESNFESGEKYSVGISYEVYPKQTVYFFSDQIWTQGQGKYTSHWLPSIDDVNDKIEFDLLFRAPDDKTVIANGKLIDLGNLQEVNTWHFDLNNPMSSYLVAFAIGDFSKKDLVSNSGIPIELYYSPSDSLKVEPTYRYSKQIFDFLEAEIGVPYPWQNYKQVPVRDFMYAGMENTTATFFSEAFVVDSIGFNDRNYINVNAHELAHQWFGNLVTATSDAHHWLQEGFATYYALLAEKEIFGEDYYYWQLYQTAEQLKELSDQGKGESLLNPKASSLTFYQKGAWALHILRERVGEASFKKAIKNYLEKYKFRNVSTADFLDEVKAVSEIDITEFEKNWLQQSAYQSEAAYQSLLKSSFVNNYLEVSALRAIPFPRKKKQLETFLTHPNEFIAQEAVYQLAGEPISQTLPLYKTAFEKNNRYVHQAVILSLENVPKELQGEYEQLLIGDSYLTLEIVLYQLWLHFPDKRALYLDTAKGIVGFQNKNIKQLWLFLALLTEDYETSEKESYLIELKNYTSPDYSFEIRASAFELVNQLQLWDQETLANLVEACIHPTWRFAKSSKEILRGLLKNDRNVNILKKIKNQLSQEAGELLTTEMNN